MKITSAKFLKSSDCLKNCPVLNVSEIALIGRSNVGKSSFINKLCNRKNLAKTSNIPGKTRLMNYFLINEKFALVDLPGYGYAKVSHAEQEKWRQELENYLLKRENLVFVIQFIDARHDLQKNDIQMRQWLDYNNIKTITIATKIDYLKKNEKVKILEQLKNQLNDNFIPFSIKLSIPNELDKLFEKL